MNKKTILIIVSILIVSVAIASLYNTFATNVTSSKNENTINFDLSEKNTVVTVPANSQKEIIYKLKNENKGTVNYQLVINNSSSDVLVAKKNDSPADTSGTLTNNEYKYINLIIKNNSASEASITISTIMGYENGGDIIVPNGYAKITETYIDEILSTYITNLYSNASKSVVTNYDVEYNYATSVSLMNDRLGGTTEDLDAGNIRYYGANPNNYIDLDGEIYRIIGLFRDIELADGSKKDLVKVIKNDSIGDYSLDTSDSSVNNGWGTNSWSETDTMKLLNPGYESETVGGSLWWNGQNGTCYNGQNNSTTTCSFTNNGPSITIRDKIANVAWNIGHQDFNANYFINSSNRDVYAIERGSDDKWTGNVALMYPSDYGYATDLSICNKSIGSYSSTNCKDNDWLYLSDMTQWFFMKSNHNFLNWELNSDGNIYWSNSPSAYAHAIRPTLFLTDSVKIITGNGSPETPYQIEL